MVTITEVRAEVENDGDASPPAEASGDEGIVARAAARGEDDSSNERRMCIVFMDSLNMHSAGQVAGNLTNWLQNEWNTRRSAVERRAKRIASAAKAKGSCTEGAADAVVANEDSRVLDRSSSGGGGCGVACDASIGSGVSVADDYNKWVAGALSDGLTLLKPKVPRQLNGCDCGVFSLQYAEEMLFRMPFISGADVKAQRIADFTPVMFTPESIQVSSVFWLVVYY